ncbi:hypothetical protein U1Q18_042499 [Sarracenia purpurea var. burkii]
MAMLLHLLHSPGCVLLDWVQFIVVGSWISPASGFCGRQLQWCFGTRSGVSQCCCPKMGSKTKALQVAAIIGSRFGGCPAECF